MSTPSPIDWNATPATEVPFSNAEEAAPKRPVGPFASVAKKVAPSKGSAGPQQGRKATKPKTIEPPSKPGEFTEDITAFYTMAGMAVAVKDQHCGQVIVQSAPKIGEEWDNLAQANPAVRKALRSLTKATAVGTLVAAHLPIIMAISAHHGVGFGPRPEADDIEGEAADVA